MIKEGINKVIRGINLSSEEAGAVMRQVMSGEATDAQIGSFLTGLRMKGETPEEIFGCAQVMRDLSFQRNTGHAVVVDTCGTGGDGTGTFNISTTVAFVVAGVGIAVAKHGNRSVSSKSGSADVLKALGVNIDLRPIEVEQVLNKIGLGFLYAPIFHQAMKYAVGPRKEIGIRSVFNILGPLTNPARTRYQVVGVYDGTLTEPLALVLGRLGVEGACVVHGYGGLDEVSPVGPTKITHLCQGSINTFYINPEDFGFPRRQMKHLKGEDPIYNGEITKKVLQGEKGPCRETVLLNAGVAFFASEVVGSIQEGVKLAAYSIDSGKALEKLSRLIKVTNEGFDEEGIQ
jgi:anthranilate phosphoribosyltransferase